MTKREKVFLKGSQHQGYIYWGSTSNSQNYLEIECIKKPAIGDVIVIVHSSGKELKYQITTITNFEEHHAGFYVEEL